MTLAELIRHSKKLETTIAEYEFELRSIAHHQSTLTQIGSMKSSLDNLNSKISNELKKKQPKGGLLGRVFGMEETTPSARATVNALSLERNAIASQMHAMDTSEVRRYASVTSSVKWQKTELDKVRKRIEVLQNKADKLESLKNKASKNTSEKRLLGRSVKRQLADNTECPYCGDDLNGESHADHIYPVSKGGESRKKNMVLVCSSCNRKKRNLTLQAFIKEFDLDRDLIEERLTVLGKDF